jgi:8-oxo-dGTP pyrophosphatase MutT (NUDIX family)
VARLRTATATSAGGIVVRFEAGEPQLVVGCRRRDRNIVTWTLPKGTPNDGESREQTATREVGEETGLEVRITAPFDSIEYWFYFLMEPTGGDLAGHDHEFETVRWVSFDDAQQVLTFETERALVARAADAIGIGSATSAHGQAAGEALPAGPGA